MNWQNLPRLRSARLLRDPSLGWILWFFLSLLFVGGLDVNGTHCELSRGVRSMPIRFPPIPAEPLAADKVALCDRLQVASCAWYLSPGSSSLGVFRSSSGGSP